MSFDSSSVTGGASVVTGAQAPVASPGGSTLVHQGTGIGVDNTDPANPVVSNNGVLSVNGAAGAVKLNAINTVATCAALALLSSAAADGYGLGSCVWVASVGDFFGLQTSAVTADPLTTINALNRAGCQWTRLGIPNRVVWSQATWFVDNTNGNDENDGKASGTALKTFAELGRRLRRAQLSVSVTINVLTDVPDADALVLDVDSPFGLVTIAGVVSVVDTQTVTASQSRNAATNLANEITVAGYDWTPHVGRLLRVQGTNNYAVITKNVGSGVARLSELWNTLTFAQASNTGVANGAVVEIVTQTKGPLTVTLDGDAFTYTVQDIRFAGTGAHRFRQSRVNSSITLNRCVMASTSTWTHVFQLGPLYNCCAFIGVAGIVNTAGGGGSFFGGAQVNMSTGNGLSWPAQAIARSFVQQASVSTLGAWGALYIKADLGTFDLPAGKIGINALQGSRAFFENAWYGSGNSGTAQAANLAVLCQWMTTDHTLLTMDAGLGFGLNFTNHAFSTLPIAVSAATGAAWSSG